MISALGTLMGRGTLASFYSDPTVRPGKNSFLEKVIEHRSKLEATIETPSQNSTVMSSLGKVPTSIQCGIHDIDQIALLPGDAFYAVLFDHSSDCFAYFNLVNGERTIDIKREAFKLIGGKCYWSGLIAIFDSTAQLPIILALILDKADKKYYIVSYQQKTCDGIFLLLEEHFLGLREAENATCSYFLVDNNDVINCIMYWWKFEETEQTLFHVAKLNIDCHGNTSSTVLAENCSIDGIWFEPFIYDCAIHFLEHASRDDRIIKLNMDSENHDSSEIIVRGSPPPSSGVWSSPVVIRGRAFYYVFDDGKKLGELWVLDIQLNTWHKLFEKSRHTVAEGAKLLLSSNFTALFLLGNCNIDCERRAHLYCFQLDNPEWIKFLERSQLSTSQEAFLQMQQITKSTKPLFNLKSSVFIRGIRKTDQFCITSDRSRAIVFDFSMDSFVMIGMFGGGNTIDFKRAPFSVIQGKQHWHGLRCIHHDYPETVLLALILEKESKKYFLVTFQLLMKKGTAIIIEEHFLQLDVIMSRSCTGRLYEDEIGKPYIIVYWHSKRPDRTYFDIVQVHINAFGNIRSAIVANGGTIDKHWFQPFIFQEKIYFMPFDCIQDKLLCIPLKDIQQREFVVISSDRNDAFPPVGGWSNLFAHEHCVQCYVYNREENTGEIWALDMLSLKWTRYFVLREHAIKDYGQIMIFANSQLFIHGCCLEKNCSGDAHLYHFALGLFGERVFPQIQQLNAIYSEEKVQIYHGPDESMKTKILLLKAVDAFATALLDNDSIRIYVTTDEKKNMFQSFFCTHFGTAFDSNNISVLSDKPLMRNLPNGRKVFIDSLSVLIYTDKYWLSERDGQTFLVLEADIAQGLDFPRENFAFHRFERANESNVFNDWSAKAKRKEVLVETTVQPMKQKKFIDQSREAMDLLYPDWTSSSTDKDTICIPACLDVLQSRYCGPTDSNASGFDSEIFASRKRHAVGQRGEDIFLRAFQDMNIGGVLVSGFNSMDYATVRKLQPLFRKNNISQMEIDSMFIHPLIGVFLIEVKATKEFENATEIMNSQSYKKAVQQIEKLKLQVPTLIEKVCGQKCSIPLHYGICFPFATLHENDKGKSSDILHLDQSCFLDEATMKKKFQEKISLNSIDESSLAQLQKFACAMAGYRSVDFLASGYNALKVHKLLDTQSFNTIKLQNETQLFLTKEQLMIIQCDDQHQMISGPPGTGKTLVLLRKAHIAAQKAKAGNVRIVTNNKNLSCKFQKYFEKNKECIVRFPIIDSNYKVSKDWKRRNALEGENASEDKGDWLTEPDDDVFFDEFGITNETDAEFLNYRAIAKGTTVIVFTGWQHPMQILAAAQLMEKHELITYRHFTMNTVLRCSSEVIAEWQNYFPANFAMRVGHNISGQRVRKVLVKNEREVLEGLLQLIQQYKAHPIAHEGTQTEAVSGDLCSGHIVVITDDEAGCKMCQSFLASRGVRCGSIDEQVADPSLVAVAAFIHINSFEWPIVFIVSIRCIDYFDPFVLFAASRCISCLIIIERDYMAVQRSVRSKLDAAQICKEQCKFSTLFTFVSNARVEIGEFNNRYLLFDCYLAVIANNYGASDFWITEGGCQTFFEFLNETSKFTSIFEQLLKDKQIYKRVTTIEHYGSATEKSPKLLNHLWRNFGDQEKQIFWKNIQEYAQLLIAVYRKISKTEIHRNNVSEQFDPSLSKLFRNSDSWDIFVDVVGTLLELMVWKGKVPD